MLNTTIVPMEVSGDQTYEFSMSMTEDLREVSMQSTLEIAAITPYYTGSYDFTPAETAQTIPIEGLTAQQDITIQPIPSNYGRITFNGVTLTVS